MSSLSQLLASHGTLLVLDAASMRVQAGWLRSGAPALWQSLEADAGHGVFAGTEALLREGRAKLEDAGAFVFCEGPGSMLGIRTVAMALRTWQVLKPRPVYSYQSLAVAGHFAWTTGRRSFSVIADARRDTWHLQTVGADGSLAPLQRLAVADLPAGELLTPENFRIWATPPRAVASCSYDLAEIFPAIDAFTGFRAVDAADAFQHEAPEYKKWSAQVHSAASALPR